MMRSPRGYVRAKEFEERVYHIKRVSKKTTGGNAIGFTALVIIGDRKGKVGSALGKSKDVSSAIQKALRRAKENIVKVNLKGNTIPYEISHKYSAAKVLLKPAPEGSGIIAGGPVRAVLVPSLVSGPLLATSSSFLQGVGGFLAKNFASTTIMYNLFYFSLVFGFTFFYTFMQFDPKKIADDIKKRGGFIPGIRPGRATATYLKAITIRLTLVGALFLGLIAIMPFIVQSATGLASLSIGGTGILIVVSVVLDTIRQVESMMVTRNYQSFLQ